MSFTNTLTYLCNARFLSRSSWPGGNIKSVFESPLLCPFFSAVGGRGTEVFGTWQSSLLYDWLFKVLEQVSFGGNSDCVIVVPPMVFSGLLKVIWPCENTLLCVAGKADVFFRAEGSALTGCICCACFSSSLKFIGFCWTWVCIDSLSVDGLFISIVLSFLVGCESLFCIALVAKRYENAKHYLVTHL